MKKKILQEHKIKEKLRKVFTEELEFAGAVNNMEQVIAKIPRHKHVLLHVSRILESASSNVVKELFGSPRFLFVVLHLFALSDWIAASIVKDPGIINWLMDKWKRGFVSSREDLAEELARYILINKEKNFTETLIEFKKKEFIRIAALDFILSSEFNECVHQLSMLADVIIEAIYMQEWDAYIGRYGIPQYFDDSGNVCEAGMAIISLGKFGSNELNYSSDIDLILIYSHDGETAGGNAGKLSNKEFFTRLSQTIVAMLTEEVSNGTLYRIDLDLRPEGKSGDLIISLAQALYYYNTWAHLWEKLALVRTRHTAGDSILSKQFISNIAFTLQSLANEDNLFKEIYEMKNKMNKQLELEGLLERDLKSGKGGIREIEFIAQTMYAYNYDDIYFSESANTLKLLHTLHSKRYLTVDEHELLSNGYKYLRRCEHLLQLMSGRQVHALPESADALAHFSEILYFKSEIDEESMPAPLIYLERLKSDINILFEKIFLQHLQMKLDEQVAIEELLFVPPLDVQKLLKGLTFLKIPEGEFFMADLKSLVTRISAFPIDYFNNYHMRKLILNTFKEIAKKSYAKNGLRNFDLFLFSLKDKPQVLEWLLKNETVMTALGEVFCSNEVASSLIWSNPELLTQITRGIHMHLAHDMHFEMQSLEAVMENSRILKHKAVVSAALMEAESLFGRIQVQKILSGFVTQLIKHIMNWLDHNCLQEINRGSLLTFSMGRLSLNEFDYQSDLDLLWICSRGDINAPAKEKTEIMDEDSFEFELDMSHFDDDQGGRQDYLHAIQQFIKIFTFITSTGYLYKVDLRLRPNGDEGELAVSANYMLDYVKKIARPWELLAYHKLSYISGNAKLAQNFLTRLFRLIEKRIKTINLQEEILVIRRSFDESYNKDHIKYGYGNLMDIQLFLQFYQIHHNIPFDIAKGTIDMMKELQDRNILTAEDYQEMFCLWNELESIVHCARMHKEEALLDKPLNEVIERFPFKNISFSDLESLRKKMRTRLLNIRGSSL